MNLGLISLICLLAAIVIGFVKNCNVGILCTGIAAVLALVFGIKASDIIKGFSASLCIQMVGITYLFAIINGNGTLELLARKMVALVGKQKRLIPFVIYILGFIISAVGPGAIPSLAIIPVIAIPVAASAGINPIMTAIIGDLGVMSGRMSPLTPEAAVVRELMAAQGLEADTVPIMFCLILTALATMVLVYIYYKGWKVDVNAGCVLKTGCPLWRTRSPGRKRSRASEIYRKTAPFPGSTGWSGSRSSVLLLECRSDGIFNGVAVNYLWLR